MAKAALESFLAQDYVAKELIILDDADDPSFDFEQVGMPSVKYMRLFNRMQIGYKRNQCCRRAAGEIIVHFDSDDWSVPNRITDQVNVLLCSGKSVAGYHSMLFYDGNRWGCYKDVFVALGTSLCYKRDYWQRFPFLENFEIGEDNEFARIARNNLQLITVEGKSMMVARVHKNNTSTKSMSDFDPIDTALIPAGFDCD
jgi:hypothetical protein